MGRPTTRPKNLKDGFYIEIRSRGSKNGIKTRRDTLAEMNQAAKEYEKHKDVIVLGELKGGKWVNETNAKAKKKVTTV
jgi:hypothetical protein